MYSYKQQVHITNHSIINYTVICSKLNAQTNHAAFLRQNI